MTKVIIQNEGSGSSGNFPCLHHSSVQNRSWSHVHYPNWTSTLPERTSRTGWKCALLTVAKDSRWTELLLGCPDAHTRVAIWNLQYLGKRNLGRHNDHDNQFTSYTSQFAAATRLGLLQCPKAQAHLLIWLCPSGSCTPPPSTYLHYLPDMNSFVQELGGHYYCLSERLSEAREKGYSGCSILPFPHCLLPLGYHLPTCRGSRNKNTMYWTIIHRHALPNSLSILIKAYGITTNLNFTE